MNTVIQLEGKGIIEVGNDVAIMLTYAAQDVFDIEATMGNYTKDFTLQGNKNTNKILGNLFNINIIDGTFDRELKVKCSILQGGVSIFGEGYFQLLGVNNDDGVITYDAQIKSALINVFANLKDKELSDLKIAKNDDYMLLSYQNVIDSFDNTVDDRWKFLMNYNETLNVNIWDFRPAIFLKTYLDAIHNAVGVGYVVNNKTDINFNKLIIPSTEYIVDEDDIYRNTFVWATQPNLFSTIDINSFDAGIRYFGGVLLPTPTTLDKDKVPLILDNQNIMNNPNNSFNPGLQTYVPFIFGSYKVRITFDYELFYNMIAQSGSGVFDVDLVTNVDKVAALVNDYYLEFESDYQYPDNTYQTYITNSIKVLTPIGQTDFNQGSNDVISGNITLEADIDIIIGSELRNFRWVAKQSVLMENGDEFNKLNTMQGQVYTGDVAWFTERGKPQTIGNRVRYKPSLKVSNLVLEIIPQVSYNYGITIDINKFIPRKVKQRDFLKSFVDMFKMVVEYDETTNKVIYTPRNFYYDNGKKKDWTKKIDVRKNIKQEWVQDKQNKELVLSYKKDEDRYNKIYQEATKKEYGQYDFKFRNEFLTDTTRLELVFSPTPILKHPHLGFHLPAINLNNEDKYNIRILIDTFVENVNYNMIIKTLPKFLPVNKYATGLHFDNAIKPSFDLNFSVADYYFYNDLESITLNNLYNTFHRRFVSQLNSAKLLTAYFNLSNKDISDLKLSDTIYCQNSWWNINKIIDYNANNNSLTKVELISVDDYNKIVANPIQFANVGNIGSGFNPINVGNTGWVLGGNAINTLDGLFNGFVVGNNNFVKHKNAIVLGDNIFADKDGLFANTAFIKNIESDSLFKINRLTKAELDVIVNTKTLIKGQRYMVDNIIYLSYDTSILVGDKIEVWTIKSDLYNTNVFEWDKRYIDGDILIYGGMIWKCTSPINVSLVSQFDPYDLNVNNPDFIELNPYSGLSEAERDLYYEKKLFDIKCKFTDDPQVYTIIDDNNNTYSNDNLNEIVRNDFGNVLIKNNRCKGIVSNSIDGEIRDNDIVGKIYLNTNYNSSTGLSIFENTNRGSIMNYALSDTGISISKNRNNGNIGSESVRSLSAISISDPTVNK